MGFLNPRRRRRRPDLSDDLEFKLWVVRTLERHETLLRVLLILTASLIAMAVAL